MEIFSEIWVMPMKLQIAVSRASLRCCLLRTYRKVPKFLDARKLWCNLSNIQTKRPNLTVLCQKDVSGIANSEDPDPLGAV